MVNLQLIVFHTVSERPIFYHNCLFYYSCACPIYPPFPYHLYPIVTYSFILNTKNYNKMLMPAMESNRMMIRKCLTMFCLVVFTSSCMVFNPSTGDKTLLMSSGPRTESYVHNACSVIYLVSDSPRIHMYVWSHTF